MKSPIAWCFPHSTVGNYLSLFRVTGLSWPLPADIDEVTLEARLYTSMVRCAWKPHLSAPESDRSTLFAELGPVDVISDGV